MTVTTLTLRKRSNLLDCLSSGILSASHVQPWESLFHLTPQILKRSLKNSREIKKVLRQLFGKETALKWHFVYKLVNNQAKDGDGASPDRIVASQHNIMASQDNVVPSQDNVVPSQDMVALKVEVVALEVVLVEQDKLDELLIPLIFNRAKSKVNFYIRSISILIFFLWPYSTWGPKCSSF